MSDLYNIIGIQKKKTRVALFLQKSLRSPLKVNLTKTKKSQLFGSTFPAIENTDFSTGLRMHASLKIDKAFRNEYGGSSKKEFQRHESNLMLKSNRGS